MTIEKIICDLKEVKDIEQLQVLIYKLEQSLNEKNYIKHNSSKRLNGIKRVLNNGKNRPVLNCYTVYKNGYSAITDSYQMYLLKEVKLPFKCAFNSTFNEEEKDKLLNKFLEYELKEYENTSVEERKERYFKETCRCCRFNCENSKGLPDDIGKPIKSVYFLT